MSGQDDELIHAAMHARNHLHHPAVGAGVSLYGGLGTTSGSTDQLTTSLSPAQFPDQVDSDDDTNPTGTSPAAPAGGAT
jgi:hypothetical protein